MDQTPNTPQETPAENKFLPVVRSIGVIIIVLVLWSIDKVVVGRLPQGSVWRYVIGGVIVFVGLVVVLSFTERLNRKNS
jgi:hypothetical protein